MAEPVSLPADHGLMAGVPPFPANALVTLGNWQEPPFNRWAFQHVRELIPTVRIGRGAGPPAACRARSATCRGSRSAAASAS